MSCRSALLLCAMLVACPRPTPQANELPSRARDTDAEGYYDQPAGLADDFPEEMTGPADKVRRVFTTARAAGSAYLRFGIGWDGVETAPGVFPRGAETGVTPLPYVCYTPRWLGADPLRRGSGPELPRSPASTCAATPSSSESPADSVALHGSTCLQTC